MTAPAPSVCGRCSGDALVVVPDPRDGQCYAHPCPDCCCASCGHPSPGVLCGVCEARDFVEVDTRMRRAS